ncbi:ectoine hydroxylase-related dioxygenase (phytanoyl-CoA dioxygenase family) [Streptosporangium becharense]|uniref:Ectoine hydroxylase-related dioxygenase (Phytanoyl-CoA dioxygenase family) n=1 Tax=Streptosporangium becharense TaxID=1816182 RepID=A0A7W9ID98_9ACTN|nr:phytanoyl-CoA dioxygenase family protein [Streptosporangium becharense]MBB2912005.1 ectoine hydroxylase-related dioxygenase (phytanoyl-CoA dioxygenase family) [Streptosporangium becharense]MBB5818552.1 ectoine hydroxylase-related dioxygenase (phytanoyl-CoA dioxygenase family) [Streptosporangium becharense]
MADNPPVRDVTDDEVAFFQDNGWVRLPCLVEPGRVALLRDRAAGHLRARPQAVASRVSRVDEAFGQSRDIAGTDEHFRALAFAPALGRGATRLLPGVTGVRIQVTNLLIKEPGGGHGATGFHQDFPWMPMDRSAMLTVWLALVDVPADMGSLRFVSGSHRHGLLGRSFARDGDDQLSQHPWLRELRVSPPLDLAAGDATVHHALTVHGAPANHGNTPRLSFTVTYFDADALYTGTPYRQTDGLGLTVNQPFDHPAFPLVAHT